MEDLEIWVIAEGGIGQRGPIPRWPDGVVAEPTGGRLSDLPKEAGRVAVATLGEVLENLAKEVALRTPDLPWELVIKVQFGVGSKDIAQIAGELTCKISSRPDAPVAATAAER